MYTVSYPCPDTLSLKKCGSNSVEAVARKHCVVYFISGNPGLIDYYDPFMATLRTLIDDDISGVNNFSADFSGYSTISGRKRDVSIHIIGKNLSGFNDTEHEPFSASSPPHDLEAQITHTAIHLADLEVEIETLGSGILPEAKKNKKERKARKPDEVVLVGHSVGAYIALEIMHRQYLHHKASQNGSKNEPWSSLPRLRAAILLFPTVTHIARSPSGRKMSMLRSIPVLANYAPSIARAILWCVPDLLLQGVLQYWLGMSAHGADVTQHWLRSRDGVWQALYMGQDEMERIAEEKWASEMWEGLGENVKGMEEGEKCIGERTPKFFFYFGKDDHWVDNECRDQFVKNRMKDANSRVRVEICEKSIPHAFCISTLGFYPSNNLL